MAEANLKILVLLFTLAVLDHRVTFIRSANILALFPFPLKSHFAACDFLLVELAKRGHRLTVVTPFPKANPPQNYNQIDVGNCFKMPQERFDIEYVVKEHRSTFQVLDKMVFLVGQFEKILQCPPMLELQTTKNDYDLILTELFVSDALLAYAYKFRKPFILFSTLHLTPWNSNHVANPYNPAYVPYPLSQHAMGPPLSFYDRLYNTLVYAAGQYHYHYKWVPLTDQIVRKYFGPETPSVGDIAKNTSMIFTFHHFSFTHPRPLVPGVVEVGGLHINGSQSLPKDILKFLDGATDGAIYVSMGSLMRSQSMPVHVRNTFIEALRKLPQKILWKWEADELPNKPDNIMIRKWMPQRDILAHPNVKLFISHGGSFSLYEAIWEAVPIIGIPFFGDQKMNVKCIEDAGIGLQLPYEEISNDTIIEKVNSILQDKQYAQNAKKLSIIMKDRPREPLDEAIYWIEYVIKHRGARHLQSAAIFLPWYQYLLLDVLAFALSIISFILIVSYLVTHYIVRICRSTKAKSN